MHFGGITRQILHEELQDFAKIIANDVSTQLRSVILTEGKRRLSKSEDKSETKSVHTEDSGGEMKAREYAVASLSQYRNSMFTSNNRLRSGFYSSLRTDAVPKRVSTSAGNRRSVELEERLPAYQDQRTDMDDYALTGSFSPLPLAATEKPSAFPSASAEEFREQSEMLLEAPSQIENETHPAAGTLSFGICYEYAIATILLLNAAVLGLSTNAWATVGSNPSVQTSLFIIDALFYVFFLVELGFRVFAFGSRFFDVSAKTFMSNMFDLAMVVTQSVGIFYRSDDTHLFLALTTFRLFRLLRMVHITRFLRIAHVFDDLNVLVASFVGGISSLCWAVILLLFINYVFSLVIMRSVLVSGQLEESPELQKWFNDVFRTFLTLFEAVVGGCSWDEPMTPLREISPCVGLIFMVYVGIALFGMMNILTGFFCDQAMRTVQRDTDCTLALRIADLFVGEHDDVETEITWPDFQAKINSPAMDEYFRQINVDVNEARSFFDLMDADGSASLSAAEVVNGCLRLRGGARALDLAMVERITKETESRSQVILNLVISLLEGLQIQVDPSHFMNEDMLPDVHARIMNMSSMTMEQISSKAGNQQQPPK